MENLEGKEARGFCTSLLIISIVPGGFFLQTNLCHDLKNQRIQTRYSWTTSLFSFDRGKDNQPSAVVTLGLRDPSDV